MQQKSILITGCSSGIGRDAALGLRDAGWRVFASCRQEKDCEALRAEGFESPRIDYTDEASIDEGLAQTLEATGGTLGALFNNGAHPLLAAVEDLPTDGLRAIFEANFFGWHTLTRKVIPVMRAQGYGRIVNCSSNLGLVAMPWRAAYTATKHALEGYTDTLRMELHDEPIHVVLIEPGPITTMFRRNGIHYFEKYVDWKSSHRRAAYETRMIPRLYGESGPDPFELAPAAVTAKLRRALETGRPRARYAVTFPARFSLNMRGILPTRVADWITLKI
ncbi:SDR family NAD(P)-dependent oxidoreductase [Chachezhania antarctica]|uniref:SDR family NAD(P)-dependent oxidoreductase n=1 Tax=Chachezhania antarctica TaxID=2340860 RepID=UPI000EAB96AA|nr:SDR family NAD(P)-dependent oxidoreductase [Chachezhania antarctica]|tara:strand:- start:2209 stop:3039 length:831 start_codon:yes stop_codon:yes gene_type:complete